MELPLLDDVWVVWVVVVWVVVELVSGVVDGDELLGEVCATAQTADNNRIAVIKDVFLMYFLLVYSACLTPALREEWKRR